MFERLIEELLMLKSCKISVSHKVATSFNFQGDQLLTQLFTMLGMSATIVVKVLRLGSHLVECLANRTSPKTYEVSSNSKKVCKQKHPLEHKEKNLTAQSENETVSKEMKKFTILCFQKKKKKKMG